MPHQNREITRLIQAVEATAASHPDLMAAVVRAVEQADAAEADPYMLLGVLVESLVRTINRMPGSARQIAATATLRFFLARMRATDCK